MTMTIAIPSNLQNFVRHAVASGEVADEEELVTRALELYRQMSERHAALKADVQRSMAEAERGEVAKFDVDAIIAHGTQRLVDEGITG